MTRFSVGGDEDGEGEGSRIRSTTRPKRPRLSLTPIVRRPPGSINIIPGPQRRWLLSESEEEIDREETQESETDVDEEDEESHFEEESHSAEENDFFEENVWEEEEEERRNEVVTIPAETRRGVLLRPTAHSPTPPVAPANPQAHVGSSASTEAGGGQAKERLLPSTTPVANGHTVFVLNDPDVLDCLICYEPLSSPVFQCENGHIACSSCCTKSKNKCPSCSWPIGYNRCRAIEKVLEAIRVSCQYIKHGCKELVTYNKKSEHEKACLYSPCLCPHSGCDFASSSKQLYQHFSSNHVNSATRFLYNCNFSLTLNFSDKFHVFQEQNDGILFVLNNKAENLGNLVSLSCIQPSSMGGVGYDLVAKTEGGSLKFQSFTKSIPGQVTSPSSTGHFIIPCDFFCSLGQLKMDICIWRNGQCPASFPSIGAA